MSIYKSIVVLLNLIKDSKNENIKRWSRIYGKNKHKQTPVKKKK